MIVEQVRRLLCRAGHHDPLRCAGRQDHAWTWRGDRWHAELQPAPAQVTPTVPPSVRRPSGDPQHRAQP